MKLGNRGQTLVEVIVVLTVGILIIGALTFAIISSLRNAQLAKNQTQATKLAQEAVEKVRSVRDRGDPIGGNFTIGGTLIDSWQDPDLWNLQVISTCPPPNTNCYFKFGTSGFEFITSSSDIPSSAELVDGRFKRVEILSDDASTFTTQKKLTVIVRWADFAGNHESKLVTILRKI